MENETNTGQTTEDHQKELFIGDVPANPEADSKDKVELPGKETEKEPGEEFMEAPNDHPNGNGNESNGPYMPPVDDSELEVGAEVIYQPKESETGIIATIKKKNDGEIHSYDIIINFEDKDGPATVHGVPRELLKNKPNPAE